MRRGDVRTVDFDPARGSEATKRRPAVIVSNDQANRTAQRLGRGVLTVVPITSNVQRVYPFQVLLPKGVAGLSTDSKAQAEQVRAVSIGRLGPPIGRLPEAIMASIDQALRLHLAL
ncbi:MAG: type II toxin-antitoxin system PemK/MazF family toxin [Solirubrobacteraceae bacterium]